MLAFNRPTWRLHCKLLVCCLFALTSMAAQLLGPPPGAGVPHACQTTNSLVVNAGQTVPHLPASDSVAPGMKPQLGRGGDPSSSAFPSCSKDGCFLLGTLVRSRLPLTASPSLEVKPLKSSKRKFQDHPTAPPWNHCHITRSYVLLDRDYSMPLATTTNHRPRYPSKSPSTLSTPTLDHFQGQSKSCLSAPL